MTRLRWIWWMLAGTSLLIGSVGCSQAPSNPCDNVTCEGSTRCYLGECVSSCKSDEVECGKICANTKSDAKHCGKCGNECRAGEVCQEGVCTLDCKDNTTLCGSTCVDTQTDVKHCGACGTACQPGEVCNGGTCELFCAAGLERCSGVCVNRKTDSQHCGACDTACQAGEVCNDGKCELNCQTGLTSCDGKCVNTQTDRTHCGACLQACKAGEVCSAGKCELSCPDTTTNCSGACVDTQTARNHCGGCGKACGSGEICSAGQCALSCQQNLTECSGLCVNTDTDRAHCGGCGKACKDGEVCTSGSCELSCSTTQTKCGNFCVDLQTDITNCGKCGEVCSGGKLCDKGACKCPPGQTDCNGTCVNTDTDRANCGKCSTTGQPSACKSGELCVVGQCQVSCPTGQTECSGKCVDTQTDNGHCGACGKACANGQNCQAGACKCPTGQTECGGKCVDARVDNANCGSCGTQCSGGKTCQSGSCQCPTGQTDCNGTCVDTSTNKSHCGKCGTACAAAQVCVSGACSTICASGQTNCNGTCVILATDPNNCGACGNACKTGELCAASQCVAVKSFAAAGKGSSSDYGYDVATDALGNLYVTGYYYGDMAMGSTTLSSSGSGDLFVAKLDRDGKWLWVKSVGSSSADFSHAIALDSKGNAYITGRVYSGAVFGSTTVSSYGGADLFVAKINPSGQWQWVKSGGGSGSDYGYGIAVDRKDNVYVSGYFYNTATFGTATFPSEGSADVVVAKINAAGQWQWVRRAGGSGSDYGYGVAVDRAGMVWLTGYFYDNPVFGSTTLSSAGSADVFVAKLDPNGVWQWAKSGGGTGSDIGRYIATDGSGNAYISGYSYSSSTWGSTTLSSSGNADILVAKVSHNGTWLWAKQAGGSGFDYAWGIDVDPSGNVYLAGYFEKTATFGATTLSSQGDDDIFLAKLDSTGFWLWSRAGGTKDTDVGYGVHVDAVGNAYITGYYNNNPTLFGSLSLISPNSNGNEMFVARVVAEPCAQTCSSGSACCLGSCRKLDADPNNCGACGQSCSVGGSCTNKTCACPTGTSLCGAVCAKTQSDPQHCGGCGISCGGGKTCQAGSCKCPAGQTECAGVCVDTNRNGKHCGACANACKAGEACRASLCVSAWVVGGGSSSDDFANAVAVDAQGNAYITGYYQGAATFGSFSLSGKGDDNLFVVKVDPSGKIVKAIRAINAGTTSSYDTIGHDVAVDSKGNVYVTGTFYSTSTTSVQFGSLSLQSNGSKDMFLAKLDANLNVVKVASGGGSASDYGYRLAIDKNDNVFVTGEFYSGSTGSTTATFGATTLKGNGYDEVFVAKYNSNLALQKAVSFGGKDNDVGYGIVTDSSNNVYVAGYFDVGASGTTMLTFGTTTLTGNKYRDVFVAKFDNNLGFTKIVSAKGGAYYEYAYDIAVDKQDNLYIAGYWYSNTSSNDKATFGSVVLTNNNSSSYSYDIYVAKLDKNLNFTGAVNLGGTGADYAYSLRSDGTHLYLAGYNVGGGTFGGKVVKNNGSGDAIVAKLDASLQVMWAKNMGGSSSDYGYDVAVDAKGNYFVTGYFQRTGSFGPLTLSSRGGNDVFVTKNQP